MTEPTTRELAAPGRPLPLLVLSMFLALYGNAVSIVMALPTPFGDATGIAVGILLTTIVLAWAVRARFTWRELGLGRARLAASAGIGLLVALGTVVAALLFLRFPPLFGAPVTYAPADSVSADDLLRRVLFTMPLDTALPEELAFRGVLLGGLLRRYAAVSAVLLSAVPFTLWHLVIVGRTLGLTNLTDQPVFATLGFGGALLAVFVGGMLFGWLRIATGNLAASIAAHWGFNACLLVGLRFLQGAPG